MFKEIIDKSMARMLKKKKQNINSLLYEHQ